MNILDRKQTLIAIRAIGKTDGTLREKIQTVAVSALAHAGEHGDTGLMSKLVLAVNPSTATALRKYFMTFAPVTWNKGKGTFSKIKKGGAYRVADAFGVNWFDAIESAKSAVEYDGTKTLNKARRALETQALNAAEAGDVDTANLINAAMLSLNTVALKVAA